MRFSRAPAESDGAAYPVIAACLGETRRPTRAELRRLARRIRSEAYPEGASDKRLRRGILRAALAALSGAEPR
jgi:hypothetical protein